MSNYREFRRRSLKRRMIHRLVTGISLVAAAAVLVGIGWYAVSNLRPETDASGPSSGPASVLPESAAATPPESAAPAPVPEQSTALIPSAEDADWNRLGYGVQTLDTTVFGQDDGTTAMDYRLAALPAAGKAELSYFDGVTFIGDSLTQGMEIYAETGLPNAHYCAYKGIGPNSIVNGATVTRSNGKKEIAMDALVASVPNQVYILLGTNVLVRDGDYSSFLTYYSALLDMVHEAIPNSEVYVQSITPVRPEVAQKTPGLYASRLRAINDELAALALQKGCYFVNLWEVLADENGDLIADYAQPDGIHLKSSTYAIWVEYLRTHTHYTPGTAYEAGTSYYIEQ